MTDLVHTDVFGEPLEVGNIVAACRKSHLVLCEVTKITPKRVRVKTLKGSSEFLSYPKDVTKCDTKTAVWIRLKGTI